MKNNIIRKYLSAYNSGPHLMFLHGFTFGLLLLLVGIIILNLALIIIGVFLLCLGPVFVKFSKKKIDFSDKRFWIIFWTDLIIVAVFYIWFIFSKYSIF